MVIKATGAHFDLPGHNLKSMKKPCWNKEKYKIKHIEEERAQFFIKKFNTLTEGMKRQIGRWLEASGFI